MRCCVALVVLVAAVAPLRADEPRDLVERAVKAHGGIDNLERATATRMAFQGKMGENIPPEAAMNGAWLIQTPDKQKINFSIDFGGQKMTALLVMAGGKGWMRASGLGQMEGTEEMRDAQLQELSGMLHEAQVRRLLPLLRDRKFTLAALPEATVEGRAAVGVKASYPGRPDASLYFDKESHLLVKTAYRGMQGGPPVQGQPMNLQETVYGDYHEAGTAEELVLNKAGIKADGAALRAFLAKQQVDPAAIEKARALVKRLADESFEVREKASIDLVALGAPAIPALEAAMKDDDLEVSPRALVCLEKIQVRSNRDTTRTAVRLLALRFPDDAVATLLALLPGAEEVVAEDIRAALVLLAHHPGGPDPVLVRALDDKDPVRREVAHAVLGKDGGAYLDRPGRRLLLPGVRAPHRLIMYRDGKEEVTFTITDFGFFNRFDDKEFAKP